MIEISSESEIEISSESEAEEPPKQETEKESPCKRPRVIREHAVFVDSENETEIFQRDEEEYKQMHGKRMKEMKETKKPVKEPFKVFFGRKREKLIQRMKDKRYGREGRIHVVKRLNSMINDLLRVRKLNAGNSQEVLPEEECNLNVDEILDQCDAEAEAEAEECPPPILTPVSQNDASDTPFPEPVQDFLFQGKDFTEEQQLVIKDIKTAEYLVWSAESRKFFRKDISDKWVSQAVDEEKNYPEHDLRYCSCCDVKICLGNWPTHIVSQYHQIKFQIRKKMMGFCWFENRAIMPHKVEFCGKCQDRCALIKEKKELTEWDDFAIYDHSKDPEYFEYLERQKAANTPHATGRYSCIPCDKHNLSKEYYERHLTGKSHRVKMGKQEVCKTGEKKSE